MALAPPENQESETFRRDLAAAELLLPGMRAARETRSYLQWNYIFDGQKRFVVTGPWIPAKDFWQSADWRKEFAGFFEYDIFTMAMSDKNPEGKAFWTPAYLDAFGAGLMLSHGAPVTVNGKFTAVVGADVLLVFLSTFLAGFPEIEGEFLIADQSGNAIASEGGLSTERLVSAESLLGSGFDAAVSSPSFASADGVLVSVSPIAGTPWRLFHTIERSSIVQTALASTLPYGLVAAGLFLTLAGLYGALASSFVKPAMQLVEFVAAPRERHAEVEPRLPAHWQGTARRIFDSHNEATQLLHKLQQSEAKNAAVIDAALDAVIIADGDGRITGFNPAAERMFGYSAGEAIGKMISETIVPPAHRAMHEAGMRRFQETGQASVLGRRIELEGIKATGEMFPIEISIHSVDLPGQTSFAAYLRDLSAIRDADRQIAEQREKIHQSEKLSAMGSLLAGVAHELNNPLAVVVAHASLLESKARGSTKLRAQKIHSAAERCARIVKSFLALVRQKPAMREAVSRRRAFPDHEPRLPSSVRWYFDDSFLGCLALYHTTPNYYAEDHRRLIERVSEQAGAVIHNSIVFEQRRKTRSPIRSRAAEPAVAVRQPVARARTRRKAGERGGADRDGRRRIQGHQRHLRPACRRRSAARHLQRASAGAAAVRPLCALRGRRIHRRAR